MSEKNIFNIIDSGLDDKLEEIKKKIKPLSKFSGNSFNNEQLEKLKELISNYESCKKIKGLQNFYARKAITQFNKYFK